MGICGPGQEWGGGEGKSGGARGGLEIWTFNRGIGREAETARPFLGNVNQVPMFGGADHADRPLGPRHVRRWIEPSAEGLHPPNRVSTEKVFG